MSGSKKGFWKNFTWKKFLLIASYMFVVTLAVGCVWNLIVKVPVSTLFTTTALLHRTFTAIIVGFTLSGLIKKDD
jgi:hypothetical protein